MSKNITPVTYSYSLCGMTGLFVVVIPLLLLAPIFQYIYNNGFATFYERIMDLLSFIEGQINNDGLQFLYDYGALILFLTVFLSVYLNRILVVLSTQLTITDQAIIYKNIFKHIILPIEEIKGYKYEAKRYVLYSKHYKNKKINVDIALHKSDELIKYLRENFVKLD